MGSQSKLLCSALLCSALPCPALPWNAICERHIVEAVYHKAA